MNIKIIADGPSKLGKYFNVWGISILIDKDILFDTFSDGNIIRRNFKKYDINVKQIKNIVISHEHWDHTDGLWWVLENNNNVIVYICENSSEEFKQKIKSYGCNLKEVTNKMQIKSNIYSTGQIRGDYNNKPVYEQALVITVNNKNLLITGCSHPGIISIIQRAESIDNKKVSMIIGGLHLYNKSKHEIENLAVDLQLLTDKIAPCHCTGNAAIKIFKKEIPDKYIDITSGSEIIF